MADRARVQAARQDDAEEPGTRRGDAEGNGPNGTGRRPDLRRSRPSRKSTIGAGRIREIPMKLDIRASLARSDGVPGGGGGPGRGGDALGRDQARQHRAADPEHDAGRVRAPPAAVERPGDEEDGRRSVGRLRPGAEAEQPMVAAPAATTRTALGFDASDTVESALCVAGPSGSPAASARQRPRRRRSHAWPTPPQPRCRPSSASRFRTPRRRVMAGRPGFTAPRSAPARPRAGRSRSAPRRCPSRAHGPVLGPPGPRRLVAGRAGPGFDRAGRWGEAGWADQPTSCRRPVRTS